MKKIISKLLCLVVLCSTLMLSSCDFLSALFNAGEDNEYTDNRGNIEKNDDGSIKLKEELIQTLVNYLSGYMTEYDIPGYTIGEKLLLCNNNFNPLFVKFSDECYFVVAYYVPIHENPNYENHTFCCIDEYTWIGFEKAEDVKKNMDGKEAVAAFQINIQEFCKNLKTNSADVTIEHFMFYRPEFSDNIAISPQITFDHLFIYVTESNAKYISYSSSTPIHEPFSISCIELDGQYYAKELISTLYGDGRYYETDLKMSFGEYYNSLMSIMITDKYFEENETRKNNYALFKIEDVELIVSK